jgi:nucleoside-diphosphate-sugar epimerase
MNTVLVTGGAGYIGSYLTGMLLDAGYAVRVLDRMYFGEEPLAHLRDREGLLLCRGDVRTAPPQLFEGVDAVVHLAGISNDPACDLDPQITEEVNVRGTLHVAELAKGAGVSRFVFSSSCSVYGAGTGEMLDETSATAPVSLYAKSKLDAEAALSEMGDASFAVTSLRNATVYGLSPRMRFDLIVNIMTLYAYTTGKIYVLGGGKQWRPVVHVKDVCRSVLATLDAPAELVTGEVFNVGDDEQNYPVQRVATMVRDVLPGTTVEIVPDDPDKRDYHVTFEKIRRVLGFQVSATPYEGIVEVKQALERGLVEDGPRTRTVEYYRYLLDAERVVRELSMDGSIL